MSYPDTMLDEKVEPALPKDDAEEEDKPKGESDDDILDEARDRYQQCSAAESDNFKDALDDLQFLSGGLNQWDAQAALIRTAEKRPCLTVNNLPTFLHQVTNDQRQNKPAVKVHPVDDEADIETAEVEQGMIRHIEYDSNADVSYDRAVNSAAAIGFGWFRLVTEYENEDSFDQKIMYKSIRNSLSVHIDPLSQEPDGSDMQFAFIDCLESRDEFERKYPKAKANNSSLIGQKAMSGWLTADTVLVCEYYRIKKTEATLCELIDGSKGWKDELPKGAEQFIKRERKSYKCAVEWFKITGADVLERTIIKCKWIPVFPVYGDEIDINGKVIRSGIIRNAKDPFKAYNYWITCATEEVSLRPKTPFIGAVGQFETAKDQWGTANTRSYAYIEYDPVEVNGAIAPPPQRQPMADVPTGMLAMMMHAADNKKATTGLFDSSLGARGSATSGIQEREQQHQGDVANFHYTDNLNITVRHVGRCLLSMIPNYYDAARTVRILGEDDTAKQVKINQPFDKVNPKTKAIEQVTHDLTVGTYDVTVKAGASYDTKRQEAAEFLTNAMQAAKDPASAGIITYLAFKNQDIPGADEATKMLKKTLPPGIAEPEDGDEQEPMIQTPHGPMPASKVGPLIEQMGTALQNADAQLDQNKALEEQNKAQEAQNTANDLAIRQKEADTKAYEAETARQQASDKAENDRKANEIAQTKAEEEKTRAEAELIRSAAENIRAQIEADAPEAGEGETKPATPSLEDIAQLIIASRQNINGMSITSPSGQAYSVKMM